MDKVKNGVRPTFAELKNLNKMKWNGYLNVILDETEENQKYVAEVIKSLHDAQDAISNQIFEIQDMKEIFEEKYRHMDAITEKKMRETGVYKLIYGYEFQEFNFATELAVKCPKCDPKK